MTYPTKVLTITTEYLEANKPVVREQLQKAGVRLAYILDAAFGMTDGMSWKRRYDDPIPLPAVAGLSPCRMPANTS